MKYLLSSKISFIKVGFKLFRVLNYLLRVFAFLNVYGIFTQFFRDSIAGAQIIVKHESQCSFV